MTRHAAIAAFAAGAALALSACAQEPGPRTARGLAAEDGGECFSAQSVRGFSQGPEDGQIVVRVGRDHYLFETFGYCPDIDWSRSLALDTGPSTFICGGTDVDILIPEPEIGPSRCPVRMIRKLSEAEVAAMEV